MGVSPLWKCEEIALWGRRLWPPSGNHKVCPYDVPHVQIPTPSPLGERVPVPAFSSAAGGRVRGFDPARVVVAASLPRHLAATAIGGAKPPLHQTCRRSILTSHEQGGCGRC